MTLTVPRSNASPGRAARAVGVEPNTAGDALANLGQTMFEVGTAVENDRLDRQMQRLQVDMTRDLNQLRLETEQIGDPDTAEQSWQTGIQNLRQTYETGRGQDGRQLVDPKNTERFGLAFDDLANRHAFGIGRRTLELRNAERQATYMAYTHEAAKAYATGDEEVRAGTLADLDAMVDADVRAGRIDASEGQRRKQEFRADGDNARAIAMISVDPEGFQAARKAGEFAGLEATLLARYDAAAISSIEQKAKAAQTAADKAAKEQEAAIGDRLGEIRGIAGEGAVAVDEAFLDRPEVKAHPDYGQTQAAISLREEGKQLKVMSPQALRDAIAQEEGRKVKHKWETERLALMRETLADHEAGYAKDPLAYAEREGLDVPTLPEFDINDPVSFGKAVGERVVFAEQLRQEGYTENLRYFTNDEREALKDAASVEADPSERAALARQLAVSLSAADPAAISELGLDPVFSYVGEAQVSGGMGARQAQTILRGQQVIDAGNVVMPPEKDRVDAGFQVLDALFADLPDGEKLQSTIREATDAHYAATIRKSDPTADIDEDLYLRSLHEVLGGVGEANARGATGGIQVVRDVATMLPPGVSVDQVEGALDRLGRVRASPAAGQRPALQDDAAQLEQQLRAISGGQVPDFGGERPTAQDLEDLQLQAVGPDRYIFVYQAGDRWYQVYDEEGQPYSFSMKALLQEDRR